MERYITIPNQCPEWVACPKKLSLANATTAKREISPKMITDIVYLGCEWGRRMRYEPNGWYRNNHLTNHLVDYLIGSRNSYKISAVSSDNLDQYVGYSSSSTPASAFDSLGKLRSNHPSGLKQGYKFKLPEPPVDFMSEDQLLFHRAFHRLKGKSAERHQAVLWLNFVSSAYTDRQSALASITPRKYKRWLDEALRAVTSELTAIELEVPKTRSKVKTPTKIFTQLWPCKAPSIVHKAAMTDSHRDPYPISLDEQGRNQPSGLFTTEPMDQVIYCFSDNGDVYAEISCPEWKRLRRTGTLDSTLSSLRVGGDLDAGPTERPTRLLHQAQDGRWWLGEEGNRIKVGRFEGLGDFALAWQHPDQDCLRAIEGFDNQAYIVTHGSDLAFTKSVNFPHSDALRDIQSPAVQEQINQKFSEYREDIRQAQSLRLNQVEKQKRKDMEDFKRLTKDSCITRRRSKRVNAGDPWPKMESKLRSRKIRAVQKLKKLGLDEEAEDIDECYKTCGRSVICSSTNSRFTWKFSFEKPRTP